MQFIFTLYEAERMLTHIFRVHYEFQFGFLVIQMVLNTCKSHIAALVEKFFHGNQLGCYGITCVIVTEVNLKKKTKINNLQGE